MSLLACAAILVAGASVPPAEADSRPIRVVSSTATRLELAVRLLDGSDDPSTPTSREIRLERDSADGPWRMVRGLADGEVAGPDRLVTLPPDGTTDPFEIISPSIAEADGDGVTLVDLPEGDAAICLWKDGAVRAAWFLDPFFPDFRAAMGHDEAARPGNLLWRIHRSTRPGPHVRACIALCFSSQDRFREAAGILLASAAPAPGATADSNPERPLAHAYEASEAAFAFGQVGVDPPEGAARDLYRWIMAEAEAAFAAGQDRRQGETPPPVQADSVGAPSREASDSSSATASGDKARP